MSSAHRSPNLLYPGGPLENCGAAAGGEDSGGNAREEGKVVVRTRTAPAGPHPYLDRFASGMHRPFEGHDLSWRHTSIQPVLIPDLGHTGIRTKFSQAAGNNFTLDGAMTETFRNGIHGAIRNLPRIPPPDARDVRTRDYARDTRRHRANPWSSGSLIHAHMTSLEFGDGSLSSPPLSPLGCGWPRSGLLPPGSPLGRSGFEESFQDSLSPPASPLSDRRALVGYRSRGRIESSGGEATMDCPSTPLETRKAFLLREISRVRSAAAAVVGYYDQAGGIGLDTAGSVYNGSDFEPSSRWREVHPSSARAHPHGGADSAATLLMKETERMETAVFARSHPRQRKVVATAENPEALLLPRKTGRSHKRRHEYKRGKGAKEQQNVIGVDGAVGQGERLLMMPPFPDVSLDARETWDETEGLEDPAESHMGDRDRHKERARRRERGVSPIEYSESGNSHYADGVDDIGNAIVDISCTNGSSSRHRDPVRTNATATTKTQAPPQSSAATTPSIKKTSPRKPKPCRARGGLPKGRKQPQQQPRQQRLRKPISADSLFDCLLDVRFGNTTTLSPSGGARWDLKALPVGLVAAATTAEERASERASSDGRTPRGCAEIGRRCVVGQSVTSCEDFEK